MQHRQRFRGVGQVSPSTNFSQTNGKSVLESDYLKQMVVEK